MSDKINSCGDERAEKFNTMQMVKRHFFAMRNGVIADALRKAGAPFHIIFGLNLPQLTSAAEMYGPSTPLAEQLWANTTTRESMLLAPMLVDPATFSIDDARRWVNTMPESTEVADMLCFKLLRRLPYALDLMCELGRSADRMHLYTALRLAVNIKAAHPREAVKLARDVMEKGVAERILAIPAAQILESEN